MSVDRGRTWGTPAPFAGAAGFNLVDGAVFGSGTSMVVIGTRLETPEVQTSSDAGQTWATTLTLSRVVSRHGLQVVVDPMGGPKGWLCSGGGFSERGVLLETTSGGKSWIARSVLRGGICSTLAVQPGGTGTLLMWARSRAGWDRLFRSRDGGHAWRPATVPSGLFQADLSPFDFRAPSPLIAFDPTAPKVAVTAVAGRYGQCQFWRSPDAGAHWTVAKLALTSASVVFAPTYGFVPPRDTPSRAPVLMFSTTGVSRLSRIFRVNRLVSRDHGRTWYGSSSPLTLITGAQLDS